ncbi:MAG: sensor histidine kinase, partial [Roseburia sp.]|nr:sensor histidine kinase [Roseburia sp.]
KKVWKENVMVQRPGKCFFMEAAVIGVMCALSMQNSMRELIWQQNYQNFTEIENALNKNGGEVITELLGCAGLLFCIYALWYVSVCFLIPVFSLGVKEYIRQYSFIYQIFPWLKKQWERFSAEVQHIDFSEKTTKTILKIVLLNLAVLSVLSCFWVFGIFLLIIYSAALFYLMKRYCDKIGKNYQTLLWGVNRIAEGDLNTVITEDLGVFEPFRGELVKIRNGFKKAVEEEVKSQRMKTELITNVSHDLKTPLTAITTYIELLKKEDITEEERRSYIETLEKKSLRLKVLIEDLFEVSKASSNNIVLNRMDLDVVNLMKQVSIEHVEKMQEKGMELRWRVPEEKVILKLDNQKTYRIFENLFVNVQKYAMPNSRVYVEVETTQNQVKIVLKNMSAEELNFNAEEITERFVRGDSSRNTEGSGLGLAIAKSFTEAQGGKFRVEVDGDLFKAILEFPLAGTADKI